MMPTCAVIPAGGKGTRLYPLTYAVPKELLPLGRVPTIQHVVNEIVAAGILDIIVVTGAGKRAVEDHLDEVGRRGESPARFSYVSQKEQLGLGDAVNAAAGAVGERAFVVALGDGIIAGPGQGSLLLRMLAMYEREDACAVVAAQRVAGGDVSRYGVFAPGEACRDGFGVSDLVEKPPVGGAPSDMAVCARYVFRSTIFDYLGRQAPGTGGEIQLTDAIAAMARECGGVYACPLVAGERRLDVGNLRSYGDAVAFMLAGAMDA